MKKKLTAVAALAFLLGVAAATFVVRKGFLADAGVVETKSRKTLWTCGMHPQVIQEEPGNCPICGMKLTPMEGPETAAEHAAHSTAESPAAAKQLWTCSMHPQVLEEEPGNCPICEMKLVPVQAETEEQTGSSPPSSPGPSVRVSQQFLQNFAVRTATIEIGTVPVDIRTVGSLRFNERGIVSVNTKFEGWIEKAHVNYVGEPVSKGQLLFEIYSPQLVNTQKEYLTALGFLEQLEGGGRPDAIERARTLVEAARERLRWWDITDDQITALAESKSVTRTLKIFSPASGVVMEKMGDSLEGMKLDAGMTIFKIADLSTIWADVEIYEHQIRHVRLGQTAHVTADAYPGRRWTGKIIYFDPVLDSQTRTLKASVQIANPGGNLRPAMFVNVEVPVASPAGVVKVPAEAVIHSGERNIVIVRTDDRLFEPREVELGASGGGFEEVRKGLRAGEVVVTSSQFLIDSESNLREAVNKMMSESQSSSSAGAPAPAVHQH